MDLRPPATLRDPTMLSSFLTTFSGRLAPREKSLTRFILGFQPEYHDATVMEAGVLTIRGEDFVSFTWSVDYRAMGFGPLVEEIFRAWPNSMRNLVSQWPAYRDRDIPRHLHTEDDPDNIEDFICHTLAKSSLFVVRIDEKVPHAP